MFALNDMLFKNENYILNEVVLKLEEIQKELNNENLIKRIADIIIIMNKAINDNKNKFDQIIKQIQQLNSKIDNLTNNSNLNFGPKEETGEYQQTISQIQELKSKMDDLTKNNNFGPKIETRFYQEGRYEGQLVNGKREGKGKFYYLNDDEYMGKIYEGEWKNDKREGRGIETWPDGERFEGYFINDLRNGKGVYYYSNGERHEGNYKNGKKEGRGFTFYNNGDLKICNYYNDNQIGKIVLITANGEVQEAIYLDNKYDI